MQRKYLRYAAICAGEKVADFVRWPCQFEGRAPVLDAPEPKPFALVHLLENALWANSLA
jgi:hypothetical protein